jgi:hypothetical protein
VVVTPIDGTSIPPVLGEPIPEPLEAAFCRKRSEWEHCIDPYNQIYTLSLNHTYFSPLDWCFFGIPVLKKIDLGRFADRIRLSIYELVVEDTGDGESESRPLAASSKKNDVKKQHQSKDTGGCVRAVTSERHIQRKQLVWFELLSGTCS